MNKRTVRSKWQVNSRLPEQSQRFHKNTLFIHCIYRCRCSVNMLPFVVNGKWHLNCASCDTFRAATNSCLQLEIFKVFRPNEQELNKNIFSLNQLLINKGTSENIQNVKNMKQEEQTIFPNSSAKLRIQIVTHSPEFSCTISLKFAVSFQLLW